LPCPISARTRFGSALKCEPELAEALRGTHAAVLSGSHLNKRHWNTVIFDGSLPDDAIRDMIEDSYDLVVSKLPQARRRAVGWRGSPLASSHRRAGAQHDRDHRRPELRDRDRLRIR
jgi:hypothetical protein